MIPPWLVLGCALLPAAAGAADAATRTGATPQFLIDAWETDQGLPENSTRQMVQTADGFLWFGTLGGLVRFDGVRFEVFTPANTPGLPSEGLVGLHLDGTQRLWVSTLRGLAVSDPGRWRSFRAVAGWSGNYVRTWAEQAGVICVTSFDGKIFRATAADFEELPPPPGQPGQTYYGLVDREGQLGLAQTGFFGHWDGLRWVESPLAATVTRDFRGAGTARDGTLLLLTATELFHVDRDMIVRRVAFDKPIPTVWQVMEDSDGRIWLSTWGAGLHVVERGGKVQRLGARDGLLAESFRFVFEDRERNLWTGGGNGGGLVRLKPRTVQAIGLESGLPERLVKAVAQDNTGGIVVGTYGRGLVRLVEGRALPWDGPGRNSAGLYVQCLWADRQGRLWIGTYGAGLHVDDGTATRPLPATDIAGRNINSVFEDSQGRIWVGGSENLIQYANEFSAPQQTADGRPIPAVVQMAESPIDRRLWAVNEQGVYRQGSEGWEPVRTASGQPLQGAGFLRFDSLGALWTGGTSLGLWRYKAGRWSAVAEANGLTARSIYSGVEDGHGYWWWGSNRGLLRIAQKDLDDVADGARPTVAQVQVFDQSDGLQTLEFASTFSSTTLRDSQGRLWFATPRGVVMLDPGTMRLNTTPPPVQLESVSYVDGDGLTQVLQPASGALIRLPAGSRKLEANFAVLSYSAPAKVRLRHRFERDGVVVSDALQTTRVFQSDLLVPGDYRVTVTAANNDGVWNRQGATLRFLVAPQVWETGWFRGLAVLLLTGGAGGLTWQITRSRQLRQLEQLRQEQALAAEHARLETVLEANRELESFAYSVSHDLRAPLRNISGFLELLARRAAGKLDNEESRYLGTVRKEAARLSLLIDRLLSFSRLGRTEIVRAPVALGELVEEVRAELAPDIGARQVEWQIGPLPVVHVDRTLFRQVFANLLSNAVKFTRHRPVAVISVTQTSSAEPGMLTIVVSDNGVGFNPKYREKLFGVFERLHAAREFEGLGIGLAIVQRIVTRHGGRITAEGDLDKGAKFHFTVPFSEP